WFETKFHLEVVDQYILNDHAIAYWLGLEKEHFWNNGAVTKLGLSYLDKINIDSSAHFYPAFSNLFMGEVMRLDAMDLPLLALSARHHFKSKWKIYTQLNIVKQLKDHRAQELDFQIGGKIHSHFLLTSIFSFISSELLEKNYWMAKLEVRYAF
nr:hypothetical protein [Saprospiraceae bacterium]